jgi:hypothetical protein
MNPRYQRPGFGSRVLMARSPDSKWTSQYWLVTVAGVMGVAPMSCPEPEAAAPDAAKPKAQDPMSMIIAKRHSPEAYPVGHSALEQRVEALLRARFGPHVAARVFDNSYSLRLLRGGPFCPPVRLELVSRVSSQVCDDESGLVVDSVSWGPVEPTPPESRTDWSEPSEGSGRSRCRLARGGI